MTRIIDSCWGPPLLGNYYIDTAIDVYLGLTCGFECGIWGSGFRVSDWGSALPIGTLKMSGNFIRAACFQGPAFNCHEVHLAFSVRLPGTPQTAFYQMICNLGHAS